ncbi:MAG: terminase small subunit [Thermodesulfobacteriota bacterium]
MSRAKPKPAEKRPKGKLVNRAELASLFGVSANTVSNWLSRGCPCVQRGGLGKPWTFDTAAVVQWLANRNPDNGQITEDPDEKEWRKRRMAAEARRAEMALAKDEAELISADEVAKAAFDAARTLRDAILAIPDRISEELAVETDSDAVHQRLTLELTNALKQQANPSE